MRIHTLTVFLSLSLVFADCDDWGGPPPEIVLGESNAGIHLGDTPEQVQRVLGPPHAVGWADGIDRGWRTYLYNRNSVTRMYDIKVWFASSPPEVEWGGVDVVVVQQGFRGTTKEGLGMGARRDWVYRLIGVPLKSTTTDSSGGSIDYYCFHGRAETLIFLGDSLVSIALGPIAPPSPPYPVCK
jgi:hypothetical protein